MTDLKLRQQVVTEIGRHVRGNPPKDSSVDDVDTAYRGHHVDRCTGDATPEAQGTRARLLWRRPNGRWTTDCD